MLLETAEELTQLALGVAAMYLALRLVLRLPQSPLGAHVERRRAAVMCLLGAQSYGRADSTDGGR